MNRLRLLCIICAVLYVSNWQQVQAATVGINPPGKPTSVPRTELLVTAGFNVTTANPPQAVTLTLIVTNNGASTALAVSIDNLLPTEFVYRNGLPTDLLEIGDLASGETVTKTYTISIPSTVKTNRYIDEVIVSATNADSVEAFAAIDITNGRVLGATDMNIGTLATTGISNLAFMAIGFLLLGLGIRKVSRI